MPSTANAETYSRAMAKIMIRVIASSSGWWLCRASARCLWSSLRYGQEQPGQLDEGVREPNARRSGATSGKCRPGRRHWASPASDERRRSDTPRLLATQPISWCGTGRGRAPAPLRARSVLRTARSASMAHHRQRATIGRPALGGRVGPCARGSARRAERLSARRTGLADHQAHPLRMRPAGGRPADHRAAADRRR
jgi:hypothetical protein